MGELLYFGDNSRPFSLVNALEMHADRISRFSPDDSEVKLGFPRESEFLRSYL